MHLDFLIEDQSGKLLFETIIDRLVPPHLCTHKMNSYKGIGRIPKGLKSKTDARQRILLDRLPRLLKGFGKTHRRYRAAVIVVLDLDSRDVVTFRQELDGVYRAIDDKPTALFAIAIEEIEAWLLGDVPAILRAYPKAKRNVLNRYKQDSICGTWEVLADAISPGGATKLKKLGWPASGKAKCEWAKKIGPFLDLERNQSPSFQAFRDDIRALVT